MGDHASDVVAFFTAWGGASLKLPSGWFGRPYDNAHTLRCAEQHEGVLSIGLDEHQTLCVDGARLEVDGRVLRLSGFERATWEWTEYGGGAHRHAERFDTGVIELYA